MLLNEGNEVTIIENCEKHMPALERRFEKGQIVFADGSSPRVLIENDIQKADIVAVVTGSDEVNLVVSTLAKFEFAVPKVIARINDPRNQWLFKPDMGVDDAVNQAETLSNIILSEMNVE